MSVTLDDVLLMVGRLDDAPGFDTPRERFRRFISTHVANRHVARAFLEQCQRSLGEQHHRALKDLVTLLGRFLGLETAFGSYTPFPGALRYDGHWRYPGKLNLVLEVRSDQTHGADFDSLARSLAAMPVSPSSPANVPPRGLSVLSCHYPRRAVLEQALASGRPGGPITAASIRSLLTLADMVATGRVTHAEIVRILGSDLSVDLLVELLERTAASSDQAPPASTEVAEEAGFWIANVVTDAGAAPEQIVERVIGRRRLFGLRHTGARQSVPRAGDRICFRIPGAGIVGHAEVVSVAKEGVGIRDASRFSHVLHLAQPELHLASPVLPSPEIRHRLDAGDADPKACALLRISEREFVDLIAGGEASSDADGDDPALIAADSRSRE
jgi:hypothetical protein